MPHLEIKLLGPFQVQQNGEPLTGFDSDKVRALLAYLAVEADRPVRREKLAGLLWPDFSDASARTNLRQVLANLRRVLSDQEAEPPYLLPTRQAIQFNKKSDHTLDVRTFNKLVTGEGGRPPDVEDLEKAVALYQEEFLQGFSLPDAILFDEWALVTREALQRQALRALHALAGLYEEQSAFEQALRFAYRQLEIDRYQEAAHQQVMRLLARSGQRNEALAHYEDYRQFLEAELGVPPLDQTQNMHEQLQAGNLPGPAAVTVILRREPREVGPSPYRGLSAFREEDALFFFGRDAVIAHLTDWVSTKSPLAVVIGPSGSGKSSSVFSGLVPRLRKQDNWLIVQCRPRGQPFQSLAAGLTFFLAPDLGKTDQLIETEKLAGALEEGSLGLYNTALDILKNQAVQHRLLLVVDQFEELYTLCPDEETQRSFVDLLLEACETSAAQRQPPLIILLTLRADFVNQALAHRPFSDALQDNALILGPMNRPELRAAIEKPAEKQGAAFEAGLVARILDDVGDEPGNLPLLEFALTLLWEKLDQGWLTHQAYEDIGRVQGALARYADEAFTELSSEDQTRARRALIQLVQPGEGTEDTRRVATRADFGEDVWGLIQHLANKRLVVTGLDESGQDTAEVVHEALIRGWGHLQGWMAEDRAFRVWQERLRTAVRSWEDTTRDPGALLRGVPLLEAENWLNDRQEEFSIQEREFIQTSLQEQRRVEESVRVQQARERALEQAALRRLRIIVGVLVAATIMGIGLTLGIFNQSRIASRTAEENVIIASTAQAASTQAIDQQEIAEDQADARATQQAIAEQEAAARATQQAIAEENELEARSLALAASARLALGAGENDLAIALALEANQMENPPAQAQLALADAAYTPGARFLLEGHVANRIYDLSLSPGNSRALSGAVDRSMILWDMETGIPIQRYGGFRGSVLSVNYPPSGDIAILGILDGSVRFLDLETGAEVRRFLLQPPYMGAALSPDGQTALWVNDAGNLIQLDLTTGDLLQDFGESAPSDYSAAVSALAYHPDQVKATTGHVDGHLTIWDLVTGGMVLQIEGRATAIEDLVLTPDGQQALSADANGEVSAWDLNTGELIWLYQPETIEEKVFRLAVLPDGDQAVFGTMEGTLILWDLTADAKISQFGDSQNGQGHTGWVSALTVDRDGSFALTGSTEGQLIQWDLETGTIINTIEGIESRAIGTPLLSLDVSADGKTALAGYENGVIVLWDLETGERLDRYGEGIWNIESIAFETDGLSAIAVASDGKLNRWNIQTGNLSTLFERAPAGSVQTELSADGQTLIAAVRQELISTTDEAGDTALLADIFILDPNSGEVLQRLTGGHTGSVSSVALSPDGRWALSGDTIGSITLWNLADNGAIVSQAQHGDFVLDLAFSQDGTQALSSSNDAAIILWDIPSGDVLQNYSVVLNAEEVVFGPDGQTIYIGLSNGDIQVLDLETGLEINLYAGHSNIIWGLELASDGSLALSSSEDGTARAWDLTSGASARQLDWPGYQFGAALSPDGTHALSGTGGDLLYWDLENMEVLNHLSGHEQRVFDIAFSPDGSRAVSTSGDPFAPDQASMIYWDLETGQAIRKLDWEIQLYHVTITPDGRYALTSGNITSQSPTIILWDLKTGEVIDRFQTGPEDLTVATVALSPDGKKVIGGLLDDPLERDWVRLWDFETGEMLASYVGHEFSVIDLDFLPDGTAAVSASWDRNLFIWDLENETGRKISGRNPDLFSVDVDPSGKFALAGTGDGQVILWDLETGETIRNYQGHDGPVIKVMFSPKGDFAISSAFDGTVQIWRIDRTIDELIEWVFDNRYVRDLTCDERALYQVEPFCD